METSKEKNENRRGLEEGDFVIFLESNGNVDGKPDIKTTKYVFSQISQVHFNGHQVKLREPSEEAENPNYLKEGSTLGFVEDSCLVLPTQVNNTIFKPSEKGDLEKSQYVRVRIGVKGDKAYVVDGILFGKLPDEEKYAVDVRNENELVGRILVLPENICKSGDLEVDRADRILANEVAETFGQLWRENNKMDSFPGNYDYMQAMKIARDWPGLTKEYLDLMRKSNDFDSCLALISEAPSYAKILRPIFDECPELLPIYASFAGSLPKDGLAISQDQRFLSTRISTVCSVEAVRKHLENIKRIEATLNNILGPGNEGKSMLVATPFEGLAEVYLERMRLSVNERDGIYLMIRSPSGDFTTITRRIHKRGIINSAQNTSQFSNVGYMLVNNNEIAEESFLDALIKYPPMSEELNIALEGNGAKAGNQYGNFEKHVFGEK